MSQWSESVSQQSESPPHLCVRERSHVDAVLDEDGLDLRLQLPGPAQHSHGVAVGVERRAFPGVNANHHSVLLAEKKEHISVDGLATHVHSRSRRSGGGAADLQNVRLLGADADPGDAPVPGHSQDPLGVPTLRLRGVPGREGDHVVPPVPLQDPHHTACQRGESEGELQHLREPDAASFSRAPGVSI